MNTASSQVETQNIHGAGQTAVVPMAAYVSIIEQYASDGAFLWLLRNDAVNSNLYAAADLKEMDQRIAGHLDGLQMAGDLGWQTCKQQLEYEEAGEVFVAAVFALQSGDVEKIKYVCEKALANLQMRQGLISAMGWIEAASAVFWIDRFLSVDDPQYRYLGLAACSVRRHDPQQVLTQVLTDKKLGEQPQVHARALRLIGELKRRDLVPALNQAMDMDDEAIKFWANWSAVMLGNTGALKNIKPCIMEDNEFRHHALALAFNVLPVAEARKWITEMSNDPSQNRAVIQTTAILGDPHATSWLIQQMHKPLFARLAGHSFSMITGLDLEQVGLHKELEHSLPDTDEDDFEDAAEDPDADLPWPDPLKVKQYWEQYGQGLQIGQRYFLGRLPDINWLKQVLIEGNQLQRSAAAIKLAVTEPNEILPNVAVVT